jgi:hypothetical protein
MTNNFHKIKRLVFTHNCKYQKTKKIGQKNVTPKALVLLLFFSIKPIRFFEIFQKPQTRIYCRSFSKTLNLGPLILIFFQKAKIVIKKRNQIKNHLIFLN